MLESLSELEVSHNVENIFKYKNTTSWVNIKNYLYTKSLSGQFKNESKGGYLSKGGVYLFLLSIIHYIKQACKRKVGPLYVGAGSGLFTHEKQSLDSYLPSDHLQQEPLMYLLSAEHPDKLIRHLHYLKKNNVVIYSYLLAPLKVVLTKILSRFIKLDIPSTFFSELERSGMSVSIAELSYVHARFIVSIYLYKVFLYPLNISVAYVVSAYSNTELIAVLKEKGVEVNELQHGLIGVTHRSYNYRCNSTLLPTPDNVFVYNEFWKKELASAGYYKSEQIKVCGRLKYDLINPDLKMSGRAFVVFTGQDGFYDDIIEFCCKSNDMLLDNNVELLYIPHPNESELSLALLKSKLEKCTAIKIIDDKVFTTEQYIYNSLAHISVYSSCHFDAIHYKNITYILDVMQDNPMQYYIDSYPDEYVLLEQVDECLLKRLSNA